MGQRQSQKDDRTQRGDSRNSRNNPSGLPHPPSRGSNSGSRDATANGNSHGSISTQKSSLANTPAPLPGTVASEIANISSSKTRFNGRTFSCAAAPPVVASNSESFIYAPPKVPNRFIRIPKELWEDSALPVQGDEANNDVMPVGFSDSESQLLLTLWHEIASHTKNLAIKFYVSLITLHPEFRQKFAADAHVQSHAMAALRYLINLANYIDDEEAFNESINKVAAFHKALTISTDDLLVFNTVFINMVIKELPDFMFPESAYALIMFLSTVTTRMYRHLVELKTGVKYSDDAARRSLSIQRRLTSASEEFYETITEWHIEVNNLHQKRLAMAHAHMLDATTSRALGGVLAPCMSNQPTNHSSLSTVGKGKGKGKKK